MSTVLRCSFATILLALQQQLVTKTGLDSSRVMITVLDVDDIPHFGAEQDVLIKPFEEEPVVDIIDGGGRFDNRRMRSMDVICRTRVFLDQSAQDAVRLTDSALGHIYLEDKVVDALELFIVADNHDNALTTQCRVGRLSPPRRPSAQKFKEHGWVSSSFRVQVEYTRNLDISIV